MIYDRNDAANIENAIDRCLYSGYDEEVSEDNEILSENQDY